VRAAGTRPAVRLLGLVRAERGHPRAAQPRTHHLPLGRRDRRRGPDRRHQRHLREPQQARQARGPPRLRIPEPGKPAPASPHRLHPGNPAQDTRPHEKQNTQGNQAAARSRLTSKAQISISSSRVKPVVWYMAMACFFGLSVVTQSFLDTGHLSFRRAVGGINFA
jgi:hypothetical protein